MTEVKCRVNNCHYWSNNHCTANSIEIAKNFMGGTDMEAGSLGNDSNTSSHTQCTTFKSKE